MVYYYVASFTCPPVPLMSGHLSCTDTFAWSRGCLFIAGTTVFASRLNVQLKLFVLFYLSHASVCIHTYVCSSNMYVLHCSHRPIGHYMNCSLQRQILKVKFSKYPAIHTNYSLSNCTISNQKDLNRFSEFLGIN